MRLEEMPTLEGEIERLKQQLSECQVAAKREALLEAAAGFVKNNQVDADGGWAVEELRRMAKELE